MKGACEKYFPLILSLVELAKRSHLGNHARRRKTPSLSTPTMACRSMPETGNGIRQNSIFGHKGLGIQLINNGNNNQPSPILKSAHLTVNDDDGDASGGKLKVRGTLKGAPNSQFTIEFFVNSVVNPCGFGEGQKRIGKSDSDDSDDGDDSQPGHDE
jgi:hypothetical protein